VEKLQFRLLRADEIDCRVATVKEKGLSLLLYKDARVDQDILDETVGPMNWERRHSRENANCTVSIWDKDKEQWIDKEDTGTESYTEKEKGLASDSFKRACFNWGIGRELYTAPFMWVSASQCNITPKDKGFTCCDRFVVDEIQYSNRKITYVRITNVTKKVAIEYGKRTDAEAEAIAAQKIGTEKAKALEALCGVKGVSVDVIYREYSVGKLADLTEEQHASIIRRLEKTVKK
jgi:hypothetical protein